MPSHTVLIGYSNEQALEAALQGRGARVVARVPSLRTVAVRPSGDAASFAADVSGARDRLRAATKVPERRSRFRSASSRALTVTG